MKRLRNELSACSWLATKQHDAEVRTDSPDLPTQRFHGLAAAHNLDLISSSKGCSERSMRRIAGTGEG
jgi:hypothetical protein